VEFVKPRLYLTIIQPDYTAMLFKFGFIKALTELFTKRDGGAYESDVPIEERKFVCPACKKEMILTDSEFNRGDFSCPYCKTKGPRRFWPERQ
jgi:DNA-directed RNA polymerase subunit RPC12/RpoP